MSSEASTADRPTDRTPDSRVTLTDGAAPQLRVIDSTASDFNPSAQEVAAYLHDITAPDRELAEERAAELASRNGPHVFLDKFSAMIGPTLAHFKAGQVVGDFALLQALKAQNAPMVPHANAPGMTCCPKCQHVFRVPSVFPAKRAG